MVGSEVAMGRAGFFELLEGVALKTVAVDYSIDSGYTIGQLGVSKYLKSLFRQGVQAK